MITINKQKYLDIDLICIHQKNDIQEENDQMKYKERIHIYDIDLNQPFEDTIHILRNIDLLITIDTYIVHLAGVMNVPTWLLLGNYSEWRWSNKGKTYWYDSVELIRMNKPDKENKEKTEFKEILKTVRKKIVDTYLS